MSPKSPSTFFFFSLLFRVLRTPSPSPRYCKVGWSRGCRGECGRQVPGGQWESLGAEKRGYSGAQAAAAFRTLLFAPLLSPPPPDSRFGSELQALQRGHLKCPPGARAENPGGPLRTKVQILCPGLLPAGKAQKCWRAPKPTLAVCYLFVCVFACFEVDLQGFISSLFHVSECGIKVVKAPF